MNKQKRIYVRISDEEYNLILKRMNKYGFTNKSDYMRNMALNGYIINIDTSEIKEVLRILSNVANNINQVAHHANENKFISPDDINYLKTKVNLLLTTFASSEIFNLKNL